MITSQKTHKAARSDRLLTNRATAKPAKKARRTATKKRAERAVRPGTKQAALMSLLERPEGATIAQMCTKSGWQAHSVRAALTGFRKRGFAIARDRNGEDTIVYRISSRRKRTSS